MLVNNTTVIARRPCPQCGGTGRKVIPLEEGRARGLGARCRLCDEYYGEDDMAEFARLAEVYPGANWFVRCGHRLSDVCTSEWCRSCSGSGQVAVELTPEILMDALAELQERAVHV